MHDPQAVAQLADQLNSPLVKTAMVFTEAIMAERGFTQEQMSGANHFKTILLNIGEPIAENPVLPQKSLRDPYLEKEKQK